MSGSSLFLCTLNTSIQSMANIRVHHSKTKGKKNHKQTGLKRVQEGNYADSIFNLKMDRFEPAKQLTKLHCIMVPNSNITSPFQGLICQTCLHTNCRMVSDCHYVSYTNCKFSSTIFPILYLYRISLYIFDRF